MLLNRCMFLGILILVFAASAGHGQELKFHALDYVEPLKLAEQIKQSFGLDRTPRVVVKDVPSLDQMIEVVYGPDARLSEYFRNNPTAVPVGHTGANGTIYIHTSSPYFYPYPRPGTQPIEAKVRAVVIHQAIHAASRYHKGFPGIGESSSASDSLNEAVTEYIAGEVFAALYSDNYEKYSLYWFDKVDTRTQETTMIRIWAGEYVPVIGRQLILSEEELIEMYFDRPADFQRLVGKDKVSQKGRELREALQEYLPPKLH